ncbi:DUF6056 family protein [Butyrivibrio proteoclasticus]|uniref:DUF6056 family protein n=1 Tax=Butyrivibrio proteoclasticus TaxID=43305 RepID=UPI00047C9757|nr:DUF6056 family protein [Butyrivibrio proteoclasticus]
MLDKKKSVKAVVSVLAGLVLFMMIWTMIRVAYYSVIVSDDFWYAADTKMKNTNFFQYLVASWNYMVWVFNTHQGTYFSEFFNVFFNPVNNDGFPTLRIMMVLNAVLSFGSILFLVFATLKNMFKGELHIKLTIAALVIFVITQYDSFYETYFWYTGATVYSYPLSLATIGLAFMFLATNKEHKKKKLFTVLGCIFGFLGVGGSLAISGTACYFALCAVVYYFIRDKKIEKCSLFVFLSMFIGSLINTIAPGNYVRLSSVNDTGLNIAVILKDTRSEFHSINSWLFDRTNFWVILLIAALCGFFLAGKLIVDKKAYFISSIFAVLSQFVTIMPVVMGYNVPWMPNRCIFVAVFAIALSYVNLAVMIGWLVTDSMNSEARGYVLAAIIMALVFCEGTCTYQPKSYMTYQLNRQLSERVFQDNYAQTVALFDSFKDHQGEDLVVPAPLIPEEIENFYVFFLGEHESERINRAISWAYGLNSISNENQFD